MKIELIKNLPKCKFKDRIMGIYKITFDNGYFYIGSSIHLQRRYFSWRRAFSGKPTNRKSIWPSITNKIRDCDKAFFDIIELWHGDGNIFDKEQEILNKNIGNEKMINTILNPRNPIIQYDKNMNIINRFNSMKEAFNNTGVSTRKIQDCITGRRKSCKGFYFKAENEQYIKKYIKPLPKNKTEGYSHPRGKKILQFDINGNFIKEFYSLRLTARSLNIEPSSLRDYFKRNYDKKTCKGFIFKYA